MKERETERPTRKTRHRRDMAATETGGTTGGGRRKGKISA